MTKKLSLGPVIERLTGLAAPHPGDPVLTEQQRDDLRMELQKALAATDVTDMAVKGCVSVLNETERRYRVTLKFTWSWPIPVALEVQVVDQNRWIIDIERKSETL